MVSRYARKEMESIWSIASKYDAWLKVELAIVKAWGKIGLISEDVCNKICNDAKYNLQDIEEIEKITKHDVIAFTTSVSKSLGSNSKWFHYGITSSDCIDTANSILMIDSLKIIIEDVKEILKTLKARAFEFKDTLMVGRSHGIHGECITFGLVLANFYSEIKRHLDSLNNTLKIISVGKISGAMGNMAHSSIELEEFTCEFLGIKPAEISNQIIQRDRYARLVSDLALLASSCEKIAVEIRHLQRSEVYEAEEYFSAGQKGSSAMPHKRNPILSENITGLCRIIRSYVIPALENVALWHQRDISHSSVERFILPDSFITCDFMLNRLNNLIKNLVVYPKNMLKNLNLTGGLIFSQRVSLELSLKGLDRMESYAIVQEHSLKIWKELQDGKPPINENNESLFLQYLLEDERITNLISECEIKKYFDFNYYTRNINLIFDRVFTHSS